MPWTCPECERVLINPNAVHCCVKRDLEDVFVNKHPRMLLLFEKLLTEIWDWRDVHVSATKKCIVFVSVQTFLVIKPLKNQLNIKFYLDSENLEHPIIKVAAYGRYIEHHIRISEEHEIDTRLISFIRKSYNLISTGSK